MYLLPVHKSNIKISFAEDTINALEIHLEMEVKGEKIQFVFNENTNHTWQYLQQSKIKHLKLYCNSGTSGNCFQCFLSHVFTSFAQITP